MPDGLIVNDMVANNANISGGKLDINSVITSINNGTEVIKGTRIQLDEQGQSLQVAFNQLKTKVETIENITVDGDLSSVMEQVTTNTTNIGVMQGQISSLISNTTITKANGETVQLKDEFNSVKDTVSSHVQVINSLETNCRNARFYLTNLKLICNNNFANGAGTVAKYTCVDLKENSKKVMCKAKFIGETSIALISMKNGYRKVEDVTNKSIHVVFGKTSALVGYFVDNILTDVENVQYAQLTDDIEYSFGYELNGDNLTVYLPDGRSKVLNNSNWQQCNGQYVCWEHFTMNATSTNKNAVVKFTEQPPMP